MGSLATPAGALAVGTAVLAAGVLLHYLVRRPSLTAGTRLQLLLGLAVFPFIAAVATTASGLERTTQRDFCGSCHVMTAHLNDVNDVNSLGLAARHSRNKLMGAHPCYTCHANYGMLGYPLTKLKGMSHVWNYYGMGYRNWELPRFLDEVRVAEPYPNQNCQQCHSGTLGSFLNVREHLAAQDDIAAGSISCASAGCHGVAHPFSKRPEEL